jgi:hypothetical protein
MIDSQFSLDGRDTLASAVVGHFRSNYARPKKRPRNVIYGKQTWRCERGDRRTLWLRPQPRVVVGFAMIAAQVGQRSVIAASGNCIGRGGGRIGDRYLD